MVLDDNAGFTVSTDGGAPMLLLPAEALPRGGELCQSLAAGQASGARPAVVGVRLWAAVLVGVASAVAVSQFVW